MFSIGEFARLGQVSPHILHHYDQLGLLVPWEIGAENGIADPVPGHILMGVAARGGGQPLFSAKEDRQQPHSVYNMFSKKY